MGASVSCQLFDTISCTIQWMLHEQLGIVGVTHLLDDYIFVGPPRKSFCMNSLLSFELHIATLRHPFKVPTPSHLVGLT